ncbi:MAG: transposase [Myxococcota bacterium]|nr:transposase [Myxococcota bacterium]
MHVILRVRDDVPRLRQRGIYHAIRKVLLRVLALADIRVIHISIQRAHLHLIVEATDERALSSGMQSFAINAARGINRACERTGKVFRFRYKAKQITTRSYARNVIAYVLNNWRRHREDRNDRNWGNTLLDAFSSAISFTGWAGNPRWNGPRDYEPLPVASPRTDLLRSAWQWHGLIDPFERPGPA